MNCLSPVSWLLGGYECFHLDYSNDFKNSEVGVDKSTDDLNFLGT